MKLGEIATTNLTGRYLKIIDIKTLPVSNLDYKNGDYLKITDGITGNGECIEVEKYGSFAITRIRSDERPNGGVELMPAGFDPKGGTNVNRNVYYIVRTQAAYLAACDKLEALGEKVNRGYGVGDTWIYLVFWSGVEWGLSNNPTGTEAKISDLGVSTESKYKLKPGAWYTSTSWQDGSYAKLKKHEENLFYFTEAFIGVCAPLSSFQKNESWYAPLDRLTEVPLEQIVLDLDPSHPDYIAYYSDCGVTEPVPAETTYDRHIRENRDLLDEAIRRYPIGTQFKCGLTGYSRTVHFTPKFVGITNSIEGGEGYIYYEGTWGKITSEIIDASGSVSDVDLLAEANRRYPMGSQYRSADSGCIETVYHEARYISQSTPETSKIDMGCGFVYYNGKWAAPVKQSDAIDELVIKPAIYDHVNILPHPSTKSEPVDKFNQEIKLEKISKADIPKFDQNKFLSEPYNRELQLEKPVRKNKKQKS